MTGNIWSKDTRSPLNSVLFNVENNVQQGDDIMLQETKILNNAQIITLPDTPFELLPDPGAGKVYHIFDVVVTTTIITEYANVSSPSMLFVVMSGGSLFGFDADDAAIYFPDAPSVRMDRETNDELVASEAVNILADNPAGDFTGGHANNTMQVDVFYVLIDIL